MTSAIIYSKQVFTKGNLQEASIFIKDGKIQKVLRGKHQAENWFFEDYGNHIVMPGLIDAHIHINEPGRTEWEGFDTATQAAAAGGITTLVDMPLNSHPVTIDENTFQLKLEATQDKLHVNCGFWGGLVPQNAADLEELLTSGVLGLKAFLTHSGIDDFPNVEKADLQRAMPQIAMRKIPLLAHCELDESGAGFDAFEHNPHSYQHFLKSRPPSWENEAVRMMIALCRTYNCPVHIVHLSSAEVLPDIQKAKEEGLPLTVETCPHYLYFNAEAIPDKDTRFKCTPPIREAANQVQLWQALESGLIDFIATDHSPAPLAIKEASSGNLYKAWGGIIGGQCLLSATWTKAKDRNIPINQLVKWLCEKPAQFIGFQDSKGKIEKDYDADIVIWNPENSFRVEEETLFHRHKYSPYVGETLWGETIATFCNGQKVFENGKMVNLGCGKTILK